MRVFFGKYWCWLFVLLIGPVLEYLTYRYHLQAAPISPVLPFFVLVLFLPPWEAATGFLIAVSYSTIAMITVSHPDTQAVVIRVLLLVFFAILILVVKKRLDRTSLLLKTIQEREAELEAVLLAAPNGFIISNDHGNITFVNYKAIKDFRYEPGEMEHLHIKDLVPPKSREQHSKNRELYYNNPTNRKMAHDSIVEAFRKDGTTFYADIFLGPLTWKGKLQIIAIVNDVSERIKIASLEESLRMRDQFLSIAAHELKTPIGSIILYADLLEANFYKSLNTKSQYIDFFEEQKAIIEKSIIVIQRQATTISRLINQFLDISVIKHGKINLVKERFNLSSLLKEVCELSQIQTSEHKIILTYNKEIYIYADKIRIEQIVVNLLNNAIKYSPNNGSIEVKALQVGDTPIQLTVRDHGVGIREEDRDKIFTKFYRARPDLSPNGLGLGLYLSREIVLQHNGIITFESPDYGGTIFTIILPSA